MNEKAKRIKYIRLLEKFFSRTMSLLKLENFDSELFCERVKKNFEELDKKAEKTDLNSNYLVGLKNFIDLTMQKVYQEKFTDEDKESLLKEANTLHKEKNKKNYKKDKHKHKSFNDGY